MPGIPVDINADLLIPDVVSLNLAPAEMTAQSIDNLAVMCNLKYLGIAPDEGKSRLSRVFDHQDKI